MSECFQITLDELANEEPAERQSKTQDQTVPEGRLRAVRKTGIIFCLTGAACLIFAGILMIASPAAVEQLNESSMISLNGSGILLLLAVLALVVGALLVLKK